MRLYQVEMSSNPIIMSFEEEGHLDTGTERRTLCEHGGRDYSDASTRQERGGLPATTGS